MLVYRHDAELIGFAAFDFNTADRAFGAAVDVVAQHLHVIHFIDVVAGQNQHMLGFVMLLHDTDILPNRIGGAAVPHRFVYLLAGGQHIDKLAAVARHKRPGMLQVAQQRMSFVLGNHADFEQIGVETI